MKKQDKKYAPHQKHWSVYVTKGMQHQILFEDEGAARYHHERYGGVLVKPAN